jgi:hypothetical protein
MPLNSTSCLLVRTRFNPGAWTALMRQRRRGGTTYVAGGLGLRRCVRWLARGFRVVIFVSLAHASVVTTGKAGKPAGLGVIVQRLEHAQA